MDIQSVIGLLGTVLGMVGVIVTVVIFVIQVKISRREYTLFELMRVRSDFHKLNHFCNEFALLSWYQNVSFCESVEEIKEQISCLKDVISRFKSNDFEYVDMYDSNLICTIREWISSLENEITLLIEAEDIAIQFVYMHFPAIILGNNYNANEAKEYESTCSIIHNTHGAFSAFSNHIEGCQQKLTKRIENLKGRKLRMKIEFDCVTQDEIEKAIEKRRIGEKI